MKSILLLGPTSAGKTPLGELCTIRGIAGKNCYHFDFGEALRNICEGKSDNLSISNQESSFIKGVLDTGALLENEHFYLAEKIVKGFLSSWHVGKRDVFLLNGLPRHYGQAKDMESFYPIRKLIVLECTPEIILDRILLNTGGDRSNRSDDNIVLVRKKIKLYEERTLPLIEFYKHLNADIMRIQVGTDTTAEDMYQQLLLNTNFS
ncbi:MAG: nucleoside monophosphate kinase [Fibrobacteria bacterium]|nr:nucleoside monophosphate kinase [Fibrobacteria bacterium]